MKTKFLLVPAGAAALLMLATCVTVNVYFPAAAVKDLSRKIEEEVQKEAEKTQTPQKEPGGEAAPAPAPAPERPTEKPPAKGSASLLDTLFGVTPAYAQTGSVAAPEVSSPAIRKIIESRAAHVAALNKYKAQGVFGENNQGLVEVRSLDSLTELKDRAEVQRLVKAENADREELYREIAAAKKVDLSQLPKIRETYASTLRELARPGEWIQMPDGAWKQK